ncbi:MAG: hypothetical protein IT261_09610 [Saprospiraceae bacterium]|nr:hypothetical protein [Saprospiraceae bacterium]
MLKLIVETDDPILLQQAIAFLSSIKGEKDWWDLITEEKKRKITQGFENAKHQQTLTHQQVKSEIHQILKK